MTWLLITNQSADEWTNGKFKVINMDLNVYIHMYVCTMLYICIFSAADNGATGCKD